MPDDSIEDRGLKVKVVTVRFQAPYEAEIRNIRGQVFSREQGIAAAVDFDGRDANAIHVLIQADGRFVATARMLEDGHIGRMAVLRPFRGQGLGRTIIMTLIADARKNGITRVFLAAQHPAVGFYRKLGFLAFDEPFTEVGMVHQHMAKNI